MVFVRILYFKYSHFGYDDWDLAFSSQALWNLGRGEQYSSLFDLNFFGNHTSFIAYLFVPLYKVFPHPFTLLVLKVLFFIAAAYLFYAMARPYLGRAAVLLMLLYILYPPNIFSLLYDFDYENLAPLILLGLIFCFEKEKWAGFLGLSLILISIKENLPLTIVAFGILGLLTKKDKWHWGLVPIGMGGIFFYVLTSVLVPFFNSGHLNQAHPYLRNYSNFGHSLPDVFKTFLTQPSQILALFGDPPRQEWLLMIFGPLCFLPLLSLPMMLLAFPLLAQHFLSSNSSEHTFLHYYIMTFAPFVFWGTVRILAKCRASVPKLYLSLLVFVCIFSAAIFCLLRDLIVTRTLPSGYAPEHLASFKLKMLKEIPPQSSVVATFAFLPELSTRSNVYAFYRVYGQDINYDPPRRIRSNIPGDVEYAYIDFFDIRFSHELDSNFPGNPLIYKFFQNDWSVKNAVEGVVLFERKNDPLRLVEVSREPFLKSSPTLNARVADQITLLSVTKGVPLRQNDAILPLAFYWKAENRPDFNYLLRISVKQDGRVILKRIFRIGYAIYPTKSWQSGDYIKEYYWLYAPNVDFNKADLTFDFCVIGEIDKKLKIIPIQKEGQIVAREASEIKVPVKSF